MREIKSESSEPTEPHPPRWWWTKRLLILGVAMVILSITTFQYWRYEIHRRLGAELAAIQLRREPILLEDFQVSPVADELNAALTYKAAAVTLKSIPKKLDTFLDFFNSLHEIDGATREQMRELTAWSAPVVAQTRMARSQPGVDWGITLRSPAVNSVFAGGLSQQRHLANLLHLVAYEQHLDSNDSAAIEALRDLLRLSDAVNHHAPSIVTPLVAAGISAVACSGVQLVAHDIKILPGRNSTTKPSGAASREQVISLIHDLLNEAELKNGFIRGIYADRMLQYDVWTKTPLAELYLSSVPVRPAWQPYFESEALRAVRYTGQVVQATRESRYPEVRSAMPHPDILEARQSNAAITAAMHVGDRLTGAHDRYIQLHFKVIAERRAQAIALAIRLFQFDHDNAFPDRLDQLVPDYLPSIPEDPFFATARPFNLRTVPQPMLISVGDDGKDDQGDLSVAPGKKSRADLLIPAGHTIDPNRYDRRDLVFLLGDPSLKDIPQEKPNDATVEDSESSPQDPATQPATQPAE